MPHTTLSVDECRRRKPLGLDRCGDGPLVAAKVPVKNAICALDREIAVWLQYDARDRLSRLQMDMQPYRSLPIPFTNIVLHWGR